MTTRPLQAGRARRAATPFDPAASGARSGVAAFARRIPRRLASAGLAVAALAWCAQLTSAQSTWEPEVPVNWSRFYDYDGIVGLCRQLAAGYPELCRLEFIGPSVEGRPMPLLTIADPSTGDEARKPAMWIDGNVHGNEVQGSEAALYAAWFLLERQDELPDVRDLVEHNVFHVLPMVNPDGRQHWFEAANDPNSSRSGKQPFDNDGDGLFDEDGDDDLDGDGHIVQMRKHVEPGTGTHRLAPDDPRVMLRVPADERVKVGADWVMLGGEGFDNDGDGRVDEDGPGGYDMNRNWPAGWMPDHIQYGAGEYPFSFPECDAIGQFIAARPNIAAVQSFHNNGGMILRGPGAEARQAWYPSADRAVYDAIGKDGEKILPHYGYMVIFEDLYDVHGGFVNWTAEGLGIISFTNELWNDDQYFGDDGVGWGEEGTRKRLFFDDHVMLGATFVDWHEVQHPQYGTVEVGGFQKMTGRTPPAFMIEEMLHRNAMFCLFHAAQMPRLEVESLEVADAGGGAKAITLSLRNTRWIPTRSAVSASKGIGRPDLASIAGEDLVVAAGGPGADRFDLTRFSAVEHEPARLRLDRGVEGHGTERLRWVVAGSGRFTITYDSLHAGILEISGEL